MEVINALKCVDQSVVAIGRQTGSRIRFRLSIHHIMRNYGIQMSVIPVDNVCLKAPSIGRCYTMVQNSELILGVNRMDHVHTLF